MAYTVLLTETFQNQLLALPQRELPRVLEKVGLLRMSPEVDSKTKKRLVNYKRNVYRIRAGDYRILYSFGDDWIKLIGVDHRKDVYHKGELVDYDDPSIDFSQVPRIDEMLEPKDVPFVACQYNWRDVDESLGFAPAESAPSATPLGRQITHELLSSIRVDETYFDALTACYTDVDLIMAAVPEDVRNRVFDIVTSRNYQSVDQQPVKKVSKVADLEDFYNGNLLDFQLQLDPSQKSIISRIAKGDGPYRMKGAPGTGKSTVLLYAIDRFREEWIKQHTHEPMILFTTYTNALTNTSRELLNLLMKDMSLRLEVTTATRVARRIVADVDGSPNLRKADEEGFLLFEARRAIELLRSDADASTRRDLDSMLESVPVEYLIDEIEKLIVARDIKTLEAYRNESRAGRQRQLGRNQKALVWRIHNEITARLEQQRLTTWARLNQRAWHLVSDGLISKSYDAVFVDEAQDLSPNTLRLLAKLCRPRSDTNKSLYIAADSNQTIYGIGRALAWSEIHQGLAHPRNVQGFNVNYRSTLQILRGAKSYLAGAELEDEDINLTHMRKGPKPKARFVGDSEIELDQIERFLRSATRRFQTGIDLCAVLVPSNETGKKMASALSSRGMPARFMTSDNVDLSLPGIKVLTLHSAKGLEFPIVAVALFRQWRKSETESREEFGQQLRLNHMAMTRATRSLLVTLSLDRGIERMDRVSAPHWDVQSIP